MTEEENAKLSAWLDAKCRSLGVEWEQLNESQQFQLTRMIPCTLRCWRVGVPIDVDPGEKCSECGRPAPKTSRYDLILEQSDADA